MQTLVKWMIILSVVERGRSIKNIKHSLRDNIYVDFSSFSYCVRLLNGTHELGCTSASSGNVGVLHFVNSSTGLEYILKQGTHAPYIPVIEISSSDLVNVPTFKSLELSKRVSGIVLINSVSGSTDFFSPDSSCPNDGSGFYDEKDGTSCNEVGWNSVGTSLMLHKWDIPIFFLYGEDAGTLLNECIFRYNQLPNDTVPNFPLCAAQLKSPMDAAVNSEVCIRRSELITNLNPQLRCDPLGDFNVWSTLNPVDSKDGPLAKKSTIVLAARMDASGLFNNFRPGTRSAVSGLITLLLTADLLASVKEDLHDKHILFIFFNGEAFDYIGSSRVVYEMEAGRFPRQLDNQTAQNALINLDNIDMFIELGQLADLDNATLFLHSDPMTAKESPTVKTTVETISGIFSTEAAKSGASAQFLNFTQPLPPASLQRFLKAKKDLPGLVVTDHRKEFHNKFYNSFLDVFPNGFYPPNSTEDEKYHYPTVFARNAALAATVVAKSVYKYATGKEMVGDSNLNKSANLFYCFSYRALCPLFSSFFDESNPPENFLPNQFLNMYVGVNRQNTPQIPALMVLNVLSVALGEPTNLTEKECLNQATGQLYRYNYVAERQNGSRNGTCWKSTAGFSEARSPAFIERDFSRKYSTWTESVWGSDVSIRVFLQADPQQDVITLVFGVILTIFAFVIIFGFERSANDVFLIAPEPLN